MTELSNLPDELLSEQISRLPWDELTRVSGVDRRLQRVAWSVMMARGAPPEENWVLEAPWHEVVARGERLLRSLVGSEIHRFRHPIWGPPLVWEHWREYAPPQVRNAFDPTREVPARWNMQRGFRLPLAVARRQLRIFARREFWRDINDRAEVQAWLAFIPRVTDPSWPSDFADEQVVAWLRDGLRTRFLDGEALRPDLTEVITPRSHNFGWSLTLMRAFDAWAGLRHLYVWLYEFAVRFHQTHAAMFAASFRYDADETVPAHFHAFDLLLHLVRQLRLQVWHETDQILFRHHGQFDGLIAERFPGGRLASAATEPFFATYIDAYFPMDVRVYAYAALFLLHRAPAAPGVLPPLLPPLSPERRFIPDIAQHFDATTMNGIPPWTSSRSDVTSVEARTLRQILFGEHVTSRHREEGDGFVAKEK